MATISTRLQYYRAAQDHLGAASQLLDAAAQTRPQVACYLVQVGLECAFKARLLQEAEALRRPLEDFLTPKEVYEFFRTSKGHNLSLLSQQVALRRALTSTGGLVLLSEPQWTRICQEGRPYSLRYGQETVTKEDAQSAVDFAQSLVTSLRILRR